MTNTRRKIMVVVMDDCNYVILNIPDKCIGSVMFLVIMFMLLWIYGSYLAVLRIIKTKEEEGGVYSECIWFFFFQNSKNKAMMTHMI